MAVLVLLCFYLNYDLFNCDEHETNAKFNESLLIDNYHQNLLQVNAFLKDVHQKILEKSVLIVDDYENETTRDKEFVYENITNWWRGKAPGIEPKDRNPKDVKRLSEKFHPSPQYNSSDRREDLSYGLPGVFPGSKEPLPPIVIPRASTPYPMGSLPLKNPGQRPPSPRHSLRPLHSMYHTRRLPLTFLSDFKSKNMYLQSLGRYMASPSYTPGPYRPDELPFLYKNPLRPTISPPISDPAVNLKTLSSVTILSSTILTPTIGYDAKNWLEEIAPYTPTKEKFKKISRGHSEKTTVPVAKRTSKIHDYWFSTERANTGQLFNEDEHGFLHVTLLEKDKRPVNESTDPDENWMSTTAGVVLQGKITVQKSKPFPKQRYLDLMEHLNEGYMMMFIIELCRMIAVKDKWEVRRVLRHTEMIYNSLWNSGRLAWVGDSVETVTWKLSIIMSGRDIDLVRNYASMMFHMLLQRKQALSAEVNSIIDEADLFYNHNEGDRLIHSLKQFEDYPKTTKNGYWLCDSLINTFLLPFRRLSGTRRRQRLIDKLNKVVKQRLPHLLTHNERTRAETASPKNGSQSRKQKRRRHNLPHKKQRERKGHTPEYNNKNIYGKQFSQGIDSKESILRTMTPETSDQPRFRVTTTKSYRMKNKRPTNAYLNLLTQSARNRKPSYQKTSTFQDELDSFDSKNDKSTVRTFYHQHHFSRKTSIVDHRHQGVTTSTSPMLLASSGYHTLGQSKFTLKDKRLFYQIKERLRKSETKNKDRSLQLKAELLRKIIEGSSYSDEEVSLTKNLNEALKYRNRNDHIVDNDDTR